MAAPDPTLFAQRLAHGVRAIREAQAALTAGDVIVAERCGGMKFKSTVRRLSDDGMVMTPKTKLHPATIVSVNGEPVQFGGAWPA